MSAVTGLSEVVLAGHSGDTTTARAGLGDPQPEVRAAALGALARCGALTAADLRLAVEDPVPAVRRRAAEESARFEGADIALGEALLARLADDDIGVVEAAAFAVGELAAAPPGAVEALTALVTGHPEVVVRETAVAALGGVADPAGLAGVLAATTDVAT